MVKFLNAMRQVVSMSGVTQRQCNTVASLRAVYLANMRTLERRRQALTATLQQVPRPLVAPVSRAFVDVGSH